MKKIFVRQVKAPLVLILCVLLFSACNKGGKPAPDAFDKDTSYAFGMFMAQVSTEMMGLRDAQFDYNAFMEGFKAFNEAQETRISWDTAMEKVNAAFQRLQSQNEEKMWQQGEKNREEGEAFLAENAKRSGVTTTASGLQYEVITGGSGEKPGPEDVVRVHYEGTLIDGTVFDSSFQRGEPAEFRLGMVIPGWVEALQLMNVGSVYRVVIPSDLAYGSRGAGDTILPNSTLVFKVELLGIVK